MLTSTTCEKPFVIPQVMHCRTGDLTNRFEVHQPVSASSESVASVERSIWIMETLRNGKRAELLQRAVERLPGHCSRELYIGSWELRDGLGVIWHEKGVHGSISDFILPNPPCFPLGFVIFDTHALLDSIVPHYR